MSEDHSRSDVVLWRIWMLFMAFSTLCCQIGYLSTIQPFKSSCPELLPLAMRFARLKASVIARFAPFPPTIGSACAASPINTRPHPTKSWRFSFGTRISAHQPMQYPILP